jgi:hypothetical protein
MNVCQNSANRSESDATAAEAQGRDDADQMYK